MADPLSDVERLEMQARLEERQRSREFDRLLDKSSLGPYPKPKSKKAVCTDCLVEEDVKDLVRGVCSTCRRQAHFDRPQLRSDHLADEEPDADERSIIDIMSIEHQFGDGMCARCGLEGHDERACPHVNMMTFKDSDG